MYTKQLRKDEVVLVLDDPITVNNGDDTIEISEFSLNELKQTDFNIETDSISFNVKQNKPINYSIHKQYKQSIEALEPYLKDKELFRKIENEE